MRKNRRVTPENITELKENEIFVFGSNESGIHGAGAALTAKEKFGAKEGIGYGPTGQCFALPTKDWNIQGVLPPIVIECFVGRFVGYALQNTDKVFLVTKVGCGLAGYTPEQVAPFFAGVDVLDNISLPQEFWDVIDKVYLEDTIKEMEFTDDGAKNELSNI